MKTAILGTWHVHTEEYTRAILANPQAEAAVICADVSMKASGVELGFVDRFSGTLIVTGTVSQVESALESACTYAREKLGCSVCPLTKT